MDITTTEYKRCNLVAVSGRVDSNTSPQFEAALQSALESKNKLVVESSGATFMSSAGLRAMVSALKASKGAGGKLVLATPSDRVAEVMKLAGLISLFMVYDDVTAAVGSF